LGTVFELFFDSYYAVGSLELILVYLVPLLRRKRVVRRDRKDFLTLFGLMNLDFFLIIFLAYFSHYSHVGEVSSPLLDYLGLTLVIGGESFRV
jgi:hypothetical protein